MFLIFFEALSKSLKFTNTGINKDQNEDLLILNCITFLRFQYHHITVYHIFIFYKGNHFTCLRSSKFIVELNCNFQELIWSLYLVLPRYFQWNLIDVNFFLNRNPPAIKIISKFSRFTLCKSTKFQRGGGGGKIMGT